jgi:hypothetical protein
MSGIQRLRRSFSARFRISLTMEPVPLTFPHSQAQSAHSSHSDRVAVAARGEMRAPRALHLWHLTSMDAPTVAVVWSLGFAWVCKVRLPAWIPVLLALMVWVVYVIDRVLDARGELRGGLLNQSTHTLRERHYFHWRHRRIFLPLAAAAACAALWIVLSFMPLVARERNSMLAAAALVYFTRVHAGHRPAPVFPRVFSKELLVGLLFTCGCALPALARAPLWPVIVAVTFFAALAWLNCRAIDRWESIAADTGQLEIRTTAGLNHSGTDLPGGVGNGRWIGRLRAACGGDGCSGRCKRVAAGAA